MLRFARSYRDGPGLAQFFCSVYVGLIDKAKDKPELRAQGPEGYPVWLHRDEVREKFHDKRVADMVIDAMDGKRLRQPFIPKQTRSSGDTGDIAPGTPSGRTGNHRGQGQADEPAFPLAP